MPIDADEWEAGRTEEGGEDTHVKEKLLEYLELNDTRAYTADELAKVYARDVAGDAVAGESPEGTSPDAPGESGMFERFLSRVNRTVFRRSGNISEALAELEAEGRIESRTIETPDGKRTYYRAKED
ncbi:hypothetical protein BRC89_05935 [Halobacteriales archaeon QS_4_70_19]|jgi:hypothetical protein|nr:MAG: hypothetical protein BRC89_05935 [Halobacteriales archaeon QS_4_70_19]